MIGSSGSRAEKPWLLRYPWQVAPSCEYPGGNAAKLLLEWAERSPGAKPGGYLGPAWNCARLVRACRKFANALAGIGIAEGERVALLLPECAQAFIAFYGTLLAGAVAVPLEPGEGAEAEAETRRRLIETGAAALVVADAYLPAIVAAREGTDLRVIVATSKADGSPGTPAKLLPAARLPGLEDIASRRRPSGVERWSHLLRRFPDTPVCTEAGHQPSTSTTASTASTTTSTASTTASTTSTSTSTSTSLSLASPPAMIRYTRGQSGVPKGALLTHANLIAGAVQLAAWRYAEEQAQLRYLATLPLCPRRGAGAGYALAEAAAPPIAQPENRLGRLGTLGLPLPDTEARVVGEDSLAPLPPGAIGELALRGPQLAGGYWNRPQESESSFAADGWLRTGDMAVMDEDGFVTLIDRKSEVIPRGGQTVYPRRVEQELARHPAVAAATVVGVPQQQGEASIRAFIQLKGGCRTSIMQLRRWGLERLPPHEAPDEYEVCERLPSKQVNNIKIN